MNDRLQHQLDEIQRKNNEHRINLRVRNILACMVTMIVLASLLLPAFTLEKPTYCGKEEHTHKDECFEYVLDCSVTGETGTVISVTEFNKLEGAAAADDTVWTFLATDGDFRLTEKEEPEKTNADADHVVSKNTATASDYRVVNAEGDELFSVAYKDADDDNEGQLIDAGINDAAFVATSSNYTEDAASHIHTADCYKKVVVCGLEEHEHTLACYADPNADVEDLMDIEALFPTFEDEKVKDSYEYAAKLAEFQKGYRESVNNYTILVDEADNESTQGYTRYGAWAGEDYAVDWNPLFAAFTYECAGLDIQSYDKESLMDAYSWMQELRNVDPSLYDTDSIDPVLLENIDDEGNISLIRDVEGYIGLNYADYLEENEEGNEVLSQVYYEEGHPAVPSVGELVFLDLEGDDFDADHVGIITEVSLNKNRMTVMLGDIDDRVKEEKYVFDDMQVLGYARLPETEEAIRRNIEVNGEPESVEELEDFGEIELESEADTEEIEESQVELEIAYMDEVVTVEGDDYSVTLNVGSDAKIPEWAEVSVEEITEGSPEYTAYYKDALEAGGKGSEISFARFFDISFSMDGEEIEPAAPVAVSISYDDSVEIPEEGFRKAVHFTSDGGIEVLNVAGETEEAYSDMSDTTEEFIADEEPEETAVMTEAVESAAVKEVKTTDFSKDEAFAAAQSHTEEPGLFGGIKKLGRGLRNLLIKDTHDLESEMGMTETAEPETTETVTAATDNIEEETKDAAVSAASESAVKNEQAQFRKPAKAKGRSADKHTFSFVQESFSVTGTVVYKELTTSYISASGETFVIKVTYGPEAGIPDGAELKVEEILPDDKKYTDYYESARSAVQSEERADEAPADQYARFFDIKIRNGNTEIVPKESVSVSITLKDTAAYTASDWCIVHFDNGNPDVLTPEKTEDEEAGNTSLTFVADGFSVYGVITLPEPAGVNDLNGRTFTISIGDRYMTDSQMTLADSSNTNGFGKSRSSSEAAEWQFEQVSGATYKIINTSDGRYLTFDKNPEAQGQWNTRAHATLSDTGTVFRVDKAGNGYRLSAQIDSTTYYLDEHNGAVGPGFAGWYISGDNNILTLNFTQPALVRNREYMVVVKQGDNYYIVLNDGALEPAQYNEEDGQVIAEDPMMWKYDGDRLYHVTREAGFTDYDIASSSYYRYIDPGSLSGLNEDNENNTVRSGVSGVGDGVIIHSRHLWNQVRLNYTSGHKLQSTSNHNYYIGINEQDLSLIGQVSEAEAVEVFLALPLVTDSDWLRHTVNHIDISINGIAQADVPLAYGKYYDQNGNVVKEVAQGTFEKLHLSEAQVVDPSALEITPADMRRAHISASCNGTNLDNAFYITGYSGNAEHAEHSGEETGMVTSPQTRIEGSFLVANMPAEYDQTEPNRYDNDPQYRAAIRQAHLANKVEYSISVVKSIEFYLQIPVLDNDGNPVTDENEKPVYQQLYDADGKPLKIRADVAFSDSFNYWDSDNECPVFTDTEAWWYYKNAGGGQNDDWPAGDIARNNFSGMDFKLGGSDAQTSTSTYAIEITKIVVDEQGNRIKSDNIGTTRFNIYRKQVETEFSVTGSDGIEYLDVISADADDVKSLNIGSFTDESYLNDPGYQLLRDKNIQVGNDGFGLVYDYDVTPGLYYVEEDPESVKESITDTTGKEWNYKQTYIWTEYAWRNSDNDSFMHVGQTYTQKPAEGGYKGVPEILGNHYGFDGSSGPYTNDFLEFYVYNVYEAPKVNVPVIKNWDDFSGDEFDWNASFKLQWAPLYEGETAPHVSFLDVAPVRTMTITKADMTALDLLAQEKEMSVEALVAAHLSGDPALALTDGQKEILNKITFRDLPKYGTDSSGDTYRIQYSLEETAYHVFSRGSLAYSWSEESGYNSDDEDTHYMPFYPHDAGEGSEADGNYYVIVNNQKKNISAKETIDVSLEKQWDLNSDKENDDRDDTWFAEFELKRFVHTEYRDVSHMSDSDRTADPITITIKDSDGDLIDTLHVQPNVGLYLGANFAPHTEDEAVTFTSDKPVSFANGSRSTTLTVTAEGENLSNALVRSQEFFVNQNTVFTLGADVSALIADGQQAKVLDTGAGTPPMPDRSFSQTVRLDSSNNWKYEWAELLRSVTSSGDDDDNENVTYYEYYLVEKESNPKGYAQYYRADQDGHQTTVLSGDSDHQIEANDKIIAVNGPANRLIVKKLWRGVPVSTGFPGITFTLYRAKDRNGSGREAMFEHIELKGNNLEWICPVELEPSYLQDGISKPYYYYVQEDVRAGSSSAGEGNNRITTSWEMYYYRNSDGEQTKEFNQGYQAALSGPDLAVNGGTITICNRLMQYTDLDIKKQFFTLDESGSWGNTTSAMTQNIVLGFKVIRAIKTPEGKYLDEKGNESDKPVWMDYSDEMLCGYDENRNPVLDNGGNEFYLKYFGLWHFEIMNNWGDWSNVHAPDSGSSLPSYGFYIRNGEDVVVEYEYSFRETNVYKDLNRTPYPEWDWFSSITPVNGYGPGKTPFVAFDKMFVGQDPEHIVNFQASDLIIDKNWIGESDKISNVNAVYVKVWRKAENGDLEDFTAIIADDVRNNHNWQMYLNDENSIDLSRKALVLTKNADAQSAGDVWGETALKVNRALLASVAGTDGKLNAKEYQYYIQEIGYKTSDGIYRSNVGRFNPVYTKWNGTAEGGSWQPLNEGSQIIGANSIKIGAKGENKLRVTNRYTSVSGFTVSKAFDGAESSTGGQSSMRQGKYPTDGSVQIVMELEQRYRYEYIRDGITYVLQKSVDGDDIQSAFDRISGDDWNPDGDGVWLAPGDPDYDNQWLVDWQTAESGAPQTVTLPRPKPEGDNQTAQDWYSSDRAWSYTWDGLETEKTLREDTAPKARLYYRVVEKGCPDWLTVSYSEGSEDGYLAEENTYSTTAVTNTQEMTRLKLNKEWTGLGKDEHGEDITWPDGYIVYYQVMQNFHLVNMSVDSSGDTPQYIYRPVNEPFKTVDMVRRDAAADPLPDTVHQRATGTLEKNGPSVSIDGLPSSGFYTATAEDEAFGLSAGTVYPVAYTYSVRETDVKYGDESVPFREQTVNASWDAENDQYTATLTNEMVSVNVTKSWADNDPYAENVTVKLYRTTEIPADQLCQTTIRLSFGENFDKVPEEIYATVAGKPIVLVKNGDDDLWTAEVGLEKNTTATISFTSPNVEGYKVIINDQQIAVPDETTQEVAVQGNVRDEHEGRTISFTLNWTGDGSWTENSLWTSLNPGTDLNGQNVSFGVITSSRYSASISNMTSDSITLTLGEIENPNLTNYDLSVNTGNVTSQWDKQIIITIPAGEDDVDLVLNITKKSSSAPTGTGSITIKNLANSGFWYNPLKLNSYSFGLNGTLNGNQLLTYNDLAAGEYTIQMGVPDVTMVSGHSSIDDWNGNCNIHIRLADGENKTIEIKPVQHEGGTDGAISVTGNGVNYYSVFDPGTTVTISFTKTNGYNNAIIYNGDEVIWEWFDDPHSNVDVGAGVVVSFNFVLPDSGETRLTTADDSWSIKNLTITAAGANRLMGKRLLQPKLRIAAPSEITVELEHSDSDSSLPAIVGDVPPAFTGDPVDTQILNSENHWHYQWTNLTEYDPDTGKKYYYYVVEDIPDNTREVRYSRDEENGNTTVIINNSPVVNPQYASLKVIKNVEGADTDRSFTIRLKREKSGKTQWLQYTDSTNYTWKEDETDASTWTFNDGGYVLFSGLDLNYKYTVVEDTGSGKIEVEGYEFDTSSTTAASVTAEQPTIYECEILNKYIDALTEFSFKKEWYGPDLTAVSSWPADQDSITVTLSRSFLYTPEGGTPQTKNGTDIQVVVPKAGNENISVVQDETTKVYTIIIKNLEKKGTVDGITGEWKYTLKEMVPEGYYAHYFLKDSAIYQGTEYVDNGGKIENHLVTYELPSTGGPGITLIHLLGTLLISIAAAGALLLKKQQKAV